MTLSMDQLAKQIGELRRNQEELQKDLDGITSRFALYYAEESKPPVFCIISRIFDGTKADLMIIDRGYSGYTYPVSGKELVHPNEEFPKMGRWEPIVKSKQIKEMLAAALDESETDGAPSEPGRKLATASRPSRK